MIHAKRPNSLIFWIAIVHTCPTLEVHSRRTQAVRTTSEHTNNHENESSLKTLASYLLASSIPLTKSRETLHYVLQGGDVFPQKIGRDTGLSMQLPGMPNLPEGYTVEDYTNFIAKRTKEFDPLKGLIREKKIGDIEVKKMSKEEAEKEYGIQAWPRWTLGGPAEGPEKDILDSDLMIGVRKQAIKWLGVEGAYVAYIEEGKARITPNGDWDKNKPVDVQAGDFLIFPTNMSCEWEVEETIVKKYNYPDDLKRQHAQGLRLEALKILQLTDGTDVFKAMLDLKSQLTEDDLADFETYLEKQDFSDAEELPEISEDDFSKAMIDLKSKLNEVDLADFGLEKQDFSDVESWKRPEMSISETDKKFLKNVVFPAAGSDKEEESDDDDDDDDDDYDDDAVRYGVTISKEPLEEQRAKMVFPLKGTYKDDIKRYLEEKGVPPP